MWIEQDADRAGPAPWDRARTSLTTCQLTSCERRQTARSWQPVPWNEGHLPSLSTSAGKAPAAEPFSFPSSWLLQAEFPAAAWGLQGEQLRHLHRVDLLPASHQSSTTHSCSSRKSDLVKQVLLGRALESLGTQLRAAAEGQQPEPERCQTCSHPMSLPHSALCPWFGVHQLRDGSSPSPLPGAGTSCTLRFLLAALALALDSALPTFHVSRCCPWSPGSGGAHPSAHPAETLTRAEGWVLLGCWCPPDPPMTGTRAGTGTSPPCAWASQVVKATQLSPSTSSNFIPLTGA